MITVTDETVIKPHSEDCAAVWNVQNGDMKNAFCAAVIRQYFGNKKAGINKKIGNNRHWTVFGCADSSCPAELAAQINFE